MYQLSKTTKRILGAIGALWLIGFFAIAGANWRPLDRVEVVHWANGHMMTEKLFPAFAKKFNSQRHVTASGKPIEVKPLLVNSGTATEELAQRVIAGAPVNRALPNPTIFTPATEQWLPELNRQSGRDVTAPRDTKKLAFTWVGIVMLREMAQCLGWPAKEIGVAEVVALASDNEGWAKYPCARLGWGKKPLMAYTDPNSSSTGRLMLFTLYSIAAGKPAEQLTEADITRPEVVEFVKRFNLAVDHYIPDTLALNLKIFNGPAFGHFFFVGEDNLVGLYEGRETTGVFASGTKREQLHHNMVMVYPKEGSSANYHSAAILRASWVTEEQREAAEAWVSFLREEAQQ
ncbi:MAG: hypothetical protein AAB289_17525, partial [Chloroflexota bacterium]